jgi:NADPH:quinone reductase-like Zn-dependent oxidoreductase
VSIVGPLVVGASGGVGTFAVKLAKAIGGVVTGVCSTGKVAMVRAIGADNVIDYIAHDFRRLHHPVRPDHRYRAGGATASGGCAASWHQLARS